VCGDMGNPFLPAGRRRYRALERESTCMSQRLEFIAQARLRVVHFSVLCRKYGISRKTGYKWLGAKLAMS
jgi:hypothetical protein